MPIPDDYAQRQIILVKGAEFQAQRRRLFIPDEPNNMIAWAPVDGPRFRPEPLFINFPVGTIFSNLVSEDGKVSGLSSLQADGFRYVVDPIPGAENFPLFEAGPENIAKYQGGASRKQRKQRKQKSRKQRH
jgi:hypothetical protein